MLASLRWLAWALSAAVALIVLTQPVSVQAQLALGVTMIVAMAVLWTFTKGAFARQLFLALGTFVVMRYVYWRVTSTLPPLGDPVGFTFGFILLVAELYCFSILAISLIVNADPLVRKPLAPSADDDLPTVDVFVPSYNEDEYILATTIAAAKAMDYPPDKLTVWLLDDGGTDQKCNDPNPEKSSAAIARRLALQNLCDQLGAQYLTRAKNEHAKAGNMNNGLKRSKGDIIVVFDADHAPFRSFLRETVGYFAQDPKLFLVQTPHVFLNPDPIERNLQTWQKMPSENEMFYSVTQRGLDKWNGSFFCGSAALLRREALETTGGFSGITITEDCETAFELHAKGWTSVFVDKPLIAGLQPETFASFIGQRSRWCQGMFQILMLKNPAFKKGLNLIQRISYLSSMTFWFFPLPRLVFMLAPLIYIFLDIKIFVANIDETIAYTGTYIIVNMMLQNFLYGRVRWPWVSELYEYVQGVFLAKAIGSVVLSPRKPTFNVTAKGLSLDKNHLSELAWPFFAIYGLLLCGAGVAAWRYTFEPGVTNLMLVVGLWNCFNLIIAGAALGVVAERRSPDRHPRLNIERAGALMVDGDVHPVIIQDVSTGGCAVRAVRGRLPADMKSARLRIVPIGNRVGDESLPLSFRQSRPTDKGEVYGFAFEDMATTEYNALSDLMYGDADALGNFLASRRSHKSLLAGSFKMIKWGITEPIRAVSYLFGSKRAAMATAVAVSTEKKDFSLDREIDRMVEPLTALHKQATAPVQPAAIVSRPVITASFGGASATASATPRRQIAVAIGFALFAAAALPGGAFAQGYVMPAEPGTAAVSPLLPDVNFRPALQADTADARADAPAPAKHPKVVAASQSESVFRHLPNNIQGYRVTGEIGATEWPIFLTEVQSRTPLRFRLGYLASVSVMPEASSLTVSINDKIVGRTQILAPTGVRTTEFEIPPGLLRHGFNAVRIGVEQRHRVDCSLDGTYELWTQLDPSQTGLVIPHEDPGVETLADLAALPADAQGALPIRAVIPRKTGLPNIEKFVRAAQMISLIGRFEQPLVEFGPMAGGPHGINLVIGTDQDLSALPELEINTALGPRVIVRRATATQRTTVIVTGNTAEEVSQALERLVVAREPRGSVPGIRAASVFPGYHMQGGTRVKLRDLGVVSEEFSGRFFKAAVNIMMPPDFYPADYAKMLLSLDGAYASGLLPQSEIMVTVNGRNAASLKLPRAAGALFQGSEIPLPLGLLRPGLNRIEIQAQVPMQADHKCDPLATLDGKKRFLLLDSSEIILPPIARIARMPNLAVTATGAFPFTDTAVRPKLFVPAPDRETMNAAATLAARLAVSAGAPIPFEVTLTAPQAGSGPTLVVSSIRSLGSDAAEKSGLDITAIRDVWKSRIDAPLRRDTSTSPIEAATRKRVILQKNFPASCGYSNRGLILQARDGAHAAAPETPRVAAASARPRNAEAGRSLLEEWKDDLDGRNRIAKAASDAWEWASGWADRASNKIRRTASTLSAADPVPMVSVRTSLIVAQNTFGGSTNDVWTFVLAPTSETLSEAVSCLIDPRVWSQVDGRLSFLDTSEGQVTTVAAETLRFINTQAPSLGNFRLILASWLSLNQFFYVLAALLLAVLLSGSTKWLMRGLGRKS